MAGQRESILAALEETGYNRDIEKIRSEEFPSLVAADATYLDHAAATLYPKSAIEAFAKDLTENLYSNPHSPSPSSQLTTQRVDDVRLRVLRFLNADPEKFDIVFTANATAAIKIVMDGFSALPGGFAYRYHAEAHTSLVGVRELARSAVCLTTDSAVESFLSTRQTNGRAMLLSYPGQSNFSGRRFPLDWAGKMKARGPNCYTLLDAAALLTTGTLDLSNTGMAPDYIALSFYKIFGFPDLGALIVRRDSAHILQGRRYFGGGTVDSLLATETDFVARKTENPHAYLEDGTIPFHSIIALDCMMNTHENLYKSHSNVSRHAYSLVRFAFEKLSSLVHGNGRPLCNIYGRHEAFGSVKTQGPILSFNMRRADGSWLGYAEAEKLMAVKGFHVRVGGMCNAGSIELQVGIKPWEMRENFAQGHKCSDDMDIINGKPTGAIRISLGAVSTLDDVLSFVQFLEEFYVEKEVPILESACTRIGKAKRTVECITVYPIKSCAGFKVPPNTDWEVRPHGLVWDREWCLVHLGTGRALSQKAYPKMVFIRPTLDLTNNLLLVDVHHSPELGTLKIPLDSSPTTLSNLRCSNSRVCGDQITALAYDREDIVSFFTAAVGIECTLARLPASSTTRNFKPHLASSSTSETPGPKILLSNESPILVITRSSLSHLNASIQASNPSAPPTAADAFRANILLSSSTSSSEPDTPFAEDTWSHLKIGNQIFELLGGCRRCHMINIDQETAEKRQEPFVTLSKMRRIDGRILFGQHATHVAVVDGNKKPTIRVGDVVRVWDRDDGDAAADAAYQQQQLRMQEEIRRVSSARGRIPVSHTRSQSNDSSGSESADANSSSGRNSALSNNTRATTPDLVRRPSTKKEHGPAAAEKGESSGSKRLGLKRKVSWGSLKGKGGLWGKIKGGLRLGTVKG